ncbi:hypothetical protein ACFWUQ_16830, partial [Streptomyces sp. NPDC058662]
MTTNENTLPTEGDIRPLDNHASGVGIKPLDTPVEKPLDKPLDNHAADEEIQTLDNHASGPRPKDWPTHHRRRSRPQGAKARRGAP